MAKLVIRFDPWDTTCARNDARCIDLVRHTIKDYAKFREDYSDKSQFVFISNRLALDAFRLAVVQGHIPHDEVVLEVIHEKGAEISDASINRYGIINNEINVRDIGMEVTENILLAAAELKRCENAGKPPKAISRQRVRIPRRPAWKFVKTEEPK